jgi:hypothetical protein
MEISLYIPQGRRIRQRKRETEREREREKKKEGESPCVRQIVVHGVYVVAQVFAFPMRVIFRAVFAHFQKKNKAIEKQYRTK